MAKVYHADTSIFPNTIIYHLRDKGDEAIKKGWENGRYNHVADVASEDLQHAYHLTNNMHRSWTENEGVTVIGSKEQRSTSIGDIIQIHDKFYVVAGIGFDQIELPPRMPAEARNNDHIASRHI